LEGALADNLKALEIEPENVYAHIGIGVIKSEMGEFREAYDAFCRAITLEPRHARAYLLRGVLQIDRGYRETGRKDLLYAASLGLKEAYDILNDD